MLITSGGVLIRTKVEQIRETGRAAAGVRLINLDEGETLVSLERVAEEAEDEATLESDAAENQAVEAEDTPSQRILNVNEKGRLKSFSDGLLFQKKIP